MRAVGRCPAMPPLPWLMQEEVLHPVYEHSEEGEEEEELPAEFQTPVKQVVGIPTTAAFRTPVAPQVAAAPGVPLSVSKLMQAKHLPPVLPKLQGSSNNPGGSTL